MFVKRIYKKLHKESFLTTNKHFFYFFRGKIKFNNEGQRWKHIHWFPTYFIEMEK